MHVDVFWRLEMMGPMWGKIGLVGVNNTARSVILSRRLILSSLRRIVRRIVRRVDLRVANSDKLNVTRRL